MPRNTKEWNFDRIHTAQAQLADVQSDMMRCLHKSEVVDIVRERMCRRLRSAADDLDKLVLCHEIEP